MKYLQQLAWSLAMGMAFTGQISAQTIINLTQDTTVKSVGTYTYYARGDSSGNTIAPFVTEFYPGSPSNTGDSAPKMDDGLSSATSTPAPISFTSGYLTNNSSLSTQLVGGWIGINQIVSGSPSTHVGSFDVLFDLGAAYDITSVVITYTDSNGDRWSYTANAQQIFTSLTMPTSDASLSLFGSSTAVANSTNGTMTVAGTPTDAQYVDFRGEVTVSGSVSGGSNGGSLSEIAIYGYAVPEPSDVALLGLGLLLPAAWRSGLGRVIFRAAKAR